MSISRNEPPLATLLTRLPAAAHYCVAYSGGVDSHVLLHVLASHADRLLPAELSAVHVDHGVQPNSGDWARHCRETCRELGIGFELLQVDGRPQPGESPEAAARRARYRALAEWLPADSLLLTGQHRDDQAETLLLQLFRGAGPRGLAAMPALAPFGAGRLARPLLDNSREAVLDYARRQRLVWVEDPSNEDIGFDRNLLRHRLIPLLKRRWPGIDRVLARAAALQAGQARLAAALAQIDRDACGIEGHPEQLSCACLRELDKVRQDNLLRHWIETNGFPVPSRAVIEQISGGLLSARPDASPCVHWPGAQVRCYDDRLYLVLPLPEFDTGLRMTWNISEPLELPGGTLAGLATTGRGLRIDAGTDLEVRFRQGGERLRPAGRHERHALKKLFQEWRVPPWERAMTPLVFVGGELVAVAGLCICEGYRAGAGERGYELCWSRNPDSAAVAL